MLVSAAPTDVFLGITVLRLTRRLLRRQRSLKRSVCAFQARLGLLSIEESLPLGQLRGVEGYRSIISDNPNGFSENFN